MGTKIGDPDGIRTFAKVLVDWCQETQSSLQRLRSHLDQMQASMTWADDNHAAYMEEFDHGAIHLQRILAEFEQNQANRLVALAGEYDDVRWR